MRSPTAIRLGQTLPPTQSLKSHRRRRLPPTEKDNNTHELGAIDSDSSADEYVCDYEHPGQFYIETEEQERDRLFGGIKDTEEREKQYKAWCVSIGQLELGYG